MTRQSSDPHASSASSRPLSGITGPVIVFGWVSFLTDVSSEMIYPLLPLFLTTVLGAGPAFLGVVEGVAESTAAILKLYSGWWADRVRDRSRLVLVGYGLSSCSRPLIAAATRPFMVLGVRFADRIGKGIRSTPRDAMIADAVPPESRGMAFGFQRAMDHAGAVVGPLVAAAVLWWGHAPLRLVFWLAAIPGLLAVALVAWRVRDVASHARAVTSAAPRPLMTRPHGILLRYLLILLVFTLGNSSDAFLLLRAGQLGIAAALLPLLWVLFHVVKMSASLPCGMLSDRIGRRRVIASGWIVYVITYAGFALAHQPWQVWGLFALYGLFYGLTEGVERALIVDLAHPTERGGALGWYNAVIGLAALPASVLFGVLWQRAGAPTAFGVGAALAGCALVWLVCGMPAGTGRMTAHAA